MEKRKTTWHNSLGAASALALIALLVLVAVSCDPDEPDPVMKEGDHPPLEIDNGGADGARFLEGREEDKLPETKSCEKIPLDPVELPDISSGPSVVTLDQDGFFVVNGVKFFPFGFYGYPADPLGMEEFVDAGFNSSIYHGACCQGETLQEHIDALTWLQTYGVLGAGHAFAPVDQIYTELQATLQDWIDQRAATGSLLFWYTYDEPGIWSIPKDEAADYHLLLNELDPNHPNGLVQCVNEDFTEYIDYTDFMMVDPYPVPWMPLSQVKYTVLEAEAASSGNKRVFGVPQAFDWYVEWGIEAPGHIWRPLVSEMRNMTYQFLIFGVNGIYYFAYNRVHEQPDRWDGLKEIAAEVTELMPIILELNSDIEIVEEPDLPYVDHALREHDGLYYLMAINTWFNDVTVTYDLSPLGTGLCVVEYFSEEIIEVSGEGTITLDLARDAEAVLQIIP